MTDEIQGRKEIDGFVLECKNPECFITIHAQYHSRPTLNCWEEYPCKGICEHAKKFSAWVGKAYRWDVQWDVMC